jgi:dipeptidase E
MVLYGEMFVAVKIEKHIVAIGGGITSSEVVGYAVGLTKKTKPKVLIVNTATGDTPLYLEMMHSKLAMLGCASVHLPLFERTPPDLRSHVLGFDAVFVGGGNTKSMLAVWREYGLDKVLKEAWEKGIVLTGSSAGGICWFEGCCTDSYAESYIALPALGFLKGSCCPHYDGEEGRQETYQRLIREGQLADGYAIDEGVGIHFVDDKVHDVLTVREGAGAYFVEHKDSEITQTPLNTRSLA